MPTTTKIDRKEDQIAIQRFAKSAIHARKQAWFSSLLGSAALLLSAGQMAWGDYCYWTGDAGNGLWSTPGNWDGNVAPVSGDVVVFGNADHDHGNKSGTTICDIPDLITGGVLLDRDTDYFEITSMVGALSINGNLDVEGAGAPVALEVAAPLTILGGGQIIIEPHSSSTYSGNFDEPVQFAQGGEIDAYYSALNFNAGVSSYGNLTVRAESFSDADFGEILNASVNFTDLAIDGSMDCITVEGGTEASISFTGTNNNSISGYLELDGSGINVFNMPSNNVVASNIIVLDGNTAAIRLAAPGNLGQGSTLTIAEGAQVTLLGEDPLMGRLILEYLAGDSAPPVLDPGSTTPEFGPGAGIFVIDDSSAGHVTLSDNIRLDGAQIDVRGSGAVYFDLDASIQGSGFNKTGPGTLVLAGANNFTGAVTVSEGDLEPTDVASLNITGAQGALHLNGGTLFLQDLDIPNLPLYVDAPYSEILAYTPCAWSGPVTLNSTLTVAPIDLSGNNQPINFSGAISGPGGLYLQNEFLGTATVQLTGSDANTFTGGITDNCQLLELNKPAGVTAFNGPLVAGGPGGVAMGEVRWLNSGQTSLPNVTVYDNAFLNLNNFNDSFAAITLNGGQIETGTGQLSLSGPVSSNPTGVTAVISGNLDIQSSGSAIFNIGAGGVDPDLQISADLTGTMPNLIKTGPGILELSGANNFAGSAEVQQGVLEVGNNNGLGNASATVTVAAGAALQAEPGVALANPINMAGGFAVPEGESVVLTGNITLQNPTTIDVAGNLFIAANLSGVGGLTKTGAGNLTLSGNAANTYTGDTQVSGGTLTLSKPTDDYAVPGDLIIGASTGFEASPSTVVQESDSSIGGNVTVNAGSLWQLDDGVFQVFSVSNLNGTASLTLRGGGSVQTGTGGLTFVGGDDVEVIPGNSGTSTIAGNMLLYPGPNYLMVNERTETIAGPECRIDATIGETADLGVGATAQLIKGSSGTLVLTGTNNYEGDTIVSNGTLEIDGFQPLSLIKVYAATLQGNGTLGSLELDDPNAVLDPTGILSSAVLCSNFNQGTAPNGTLQIELAGEQAGTDYSQVVSSGAVSLKNLNLDASLLFYSSYGDEFTILKNNGATAPTGAFKGLPEGSVFTISGELFQITYAGGSGHDVVLTHLSPTNQPDVASWINTSGGDWNKGSNWSTGLSPNGYNVIVGVATSCVISNNASSSVAQFVYNSPLATLTGSGNLTAGGLFEWEAGAINGTGSLTANGVVHLYAPVSGNLSLTGESLVNSSLATWGSSTTLTLSDGAMISNTPTGTFQCEADGTMQNGPGATLFANDGLFEKIESFGTTAIEAPFNNSGTVRVLTGALDLGGGGIHSGDFEVAPGATLSFAAGTHTTLASSRIFGAGDFCILGGIANLNGTVTTQGAHNFTGGVVNLGDSYDAGSNAVTIGACTVNFDGTNPVAAASLTVGGYGTIGGSNTVNVSGLLAWNNSFAITGSNSLVANGGLTIASGGSLLGRSLVNMASALWSNSTVASLALGFGAIISNAPGATFDCVGNNTIQFTTGSGTVANAGLFRTIGPPATTTIEVPFDNTGTVEVQSGTLNLTGGGINAGAINVFANAVLSLGGGFFLAPGGSISGSGQLQVSTSTADVAFGGTVNVGGSNIFMGGVANLTGNYVCSNVALVIDAGVANFNSSNVISPSSLTIGGYGSLGGSNPIVVSGPVTWNSGFTVSGSNSLIANGGLTIGPGSVTLEGRTLVNMAEGLWTNNATTPNSAISLIDGAILSNAPGATFDCVGDGTIEASTATGGGFVANAGIFETIGTPATQVIQAPFSNTAVVEVQSGTLSFGEGGCSISPTNSLAEMAVFSNATIDFHGGTFLLDSSSIIDGPGNLSVSGGTASLAGEVDALGTHSFTGGTAEITGFYNCEGNALVISGGTANFNGSGVIAPSSLTMGIYGTLSGSNSVTVDGPMTWGTASTISGTNTVTANGGLAIGPGVGLNGRTLINAASCVWSNRSTAGSLSLEGGAVISNAPGATFDCIGNGVINLGFGSGLFGNGGLFRVSGGGAETSIEVPFNNNGTVEVDSGTFSLSAPFTQAAGLTFLNGGNIANSSPLQILGGELTGGGVISGSATNAGLLHPGGPLGQTTVDGSYTQTAAGTLDILLAGPGQPTGFNSLIVSNSASLAGTLSVSVTNGFEPPEGTRFQILSCASCSGVFNALNIPLGLSVNYSNNGVFLVVTGPVILPTTLQAPGILGGNLSFNFQTASNQSYTIQQNSNLDTTNWFFVTNFTGNGSAFQFETPVTSAPQNFFRVRQP
jgi:autotransporter-associated beta strand protein